LEIGNLTQANLNKFGAVDAAHPTYVIKPTALNMPASLTATLKTYTYSSFPRGNITGLPTLQDYANAVRQGNTPPALTLAPMAQSAQLIALEFAPQTPQKLSGVLQSKTPQLSAFGG
jgi:hypothetical protein